MRENEDIQKISIFMRAIRQDISRQALGHIRQEFQHLEPEHRLQIMEGYCPGCGFMVEDCHCVA